VAALIHTRLDYSTSVLVGLPAYFVRRHQSVLNAADALLVYNLKRSDRISEALVSLHWLRAPERIKYKVAVLTNKAINGSAPRYIGSFERITDQPGRQRLRSAATNRQLVPSVKLPTVGSRTFPVAGPQVWNDLLDEVTSASSLFVFFDSDLNIPLPFILP
jgi:hypothetical protein